ncbi:MAG: tyrosine-type recombinase/integrase [Myxococcales bacterium]|nr:tyrosine-type recombinase/integrase [Myxococcales bacterium]
MHNTHDKLGLPRLLQTAGCRAPAHPWHTLRHTFASHFIMQGGNILTLQKILGHSDVKMTLIYAHLAPDFLADEMDRLKFRTT